MAPAGWTIELTFTHLALEMSAGCTGGPTDGVSSLSLRRNFSLRSSPASCLVACAP